MTESFSCTMARVSFATINMMNSSRMAGLRTRWQLVTFTKSTHHFALLHWPNRQHVSHPRPDTLMMVDYNEMDSILLHS